MVLCRQHGDEPASTEAVLGLLRRIAGGGDPTLRAELRRVTLYVVPMVNPDGATAGTRVNGAGADLNRDWGTFSQPETRAVAHAVALLRPHVIVDAHNWDGGDHYNANCVEVTRDADTPLAQAAQALQAAGVAQLQASGYTVAATSYGPDADPHLAHRWFTQQRHPLLPGGDPQRRPARRGGLPAPPGRLCRPHPRPRPPLRRRPRPVGRPGRLSPGLRP